MGRSVETVKDAAAVAYRSVTNMGYDEDGEFDQDLCSIEWDDFVENMVEQVRALWPSFNDVSDESKFMPYPYSETRIICENELAQVTISEYCGCVALCLVPIETDGYYIEDSRRNNLAIGFTNRIAQKFQTKFSDFVKVGTFSNGEAVFEKV